MFLALLACSGEPAPAPNPGTDLPTDTDTDSAPVRCDPEATPAAPHFVEGDVVSGTFACTTGAPRDGLELRLVRGPSGATLDPATWTVTFPTDLASAGRRSVYVEVAGGQPLPEAVEWLVDVTDAGPGVPGNAPVDPETYLREYGLPVLHCTADAPIGEVDVGADCWFDGAHYPLARIKLRGASSLSYPKNSYTLEFPEDKLDGQALGLRNKGQLVLITTFDDNSYVRQKLVYDLWEAMAAHLGADRVLPHAEFAVLYLDGAYHGLYTTIDPIDDELFEEHDLSPDGNLYKSVNHDANFTRAHANGAPKTELWAGWEKKKGLPEDDFADLEALTAFVADSDPATFALEIGARAEVHDLMDWWLLVTYTAAADSVGKNAYLYNDPLAPSFRYVPWDFNHSWGQTWTTERVAVEQFDDYRHRNGIFDRLLDDPDLRDEISARYAALSQPGGPLTTQWQLGKLSAYYAQIGPSAERDWAVWGDAYATFSRWAHRVDLTDHAGERANLEAWIAAREASFRAASGL